MIQLTIIYKYKTQLMVNVNQMTRYALTKKATNTTAEATQCSFSRLVLKVSQHAQFDNGKHLK